MRGSNIFVMYTSADGQNVTVSPRLGTGYQMPQYTSETQLEVLEGSGVSNGMMTANVRCGNCNSWGQSGTMDFSSTSDASWIYGYKSGDALNSDDVEESISQHDEAEPFNWNLATAQGGENTNPFTTQAANEATNPSTTSTGGAGVTSSGSSSSSSGSSSSISNTILLAHGVMASLAFVAIFPIGGIIIRLANFSGLVWIHAAIQILGYLVFTCAVGMGIWIAMKGNYLTNHHPIIGLVLFVLLFAQPFGGLLHHRMYKKSGSRSIVSYLHVNLGRVLILLGMINGGLGLKLAGVARKYVIVYSVFAGVMGVAYIAAMVVGEMKKKKQERGNMSNLEKNESSSQEGMSSRG